MIHQYIHTSMAKITRLTIPSFSKDMEQLELSKITNGNVKYYYILKISLATSYTVKHKFGIQNRKCTPEHSLKKNIYIYLYKYMYGNVQSSFIPNTVMCQITTFQSMLDCIYDGSLIRL